MLDLALVYDMVNLLYSKFLFFGLKWLARHVQSWSITTTSTQQRQQQQQLINLKTHDSGGCTHVFNERDHAAYKKSLQNGQSKLALLPKTAKQNIHRAVTHAKKCTNRNTPQSMPKCYPSGAISAPCWEGVRGVFGASIVAFTIRMRSTDKGERWGRWDRSSGPGVCREVVRVLGVCRGVEGLLGRGRRL
jgi:hypothetical protein